MLWRKSDAIDVQRVNVLGVNVSAVSMDEALDVLDCWITEDARTYVCVTGVHGVMESRRDEQLREIHNKAGLVTPDGMPLVWWSRAAGCRNVTRVYGPDLLLATCQRSLTNGYRHFFYGGNDGVADLLAKRLTLKFPGLVVAGTCTPPVIPAWKDSLRMSVKTRTAPTSSPAELGRYAMGMGAFWFEAIRIGTAAAEEKKSPTVSTRVTVTGNPHWLTAYANWFGIPHPRVQAPKSTVGGVTKKQLESPAPTRSTVIVWAERLLT